MPCEEYATSGSKPCPSAPRVHSARSCDARSRCFLTRVRSLRFAFLSSPSSTAMQSGHRNATMIGLSSMYRSCSRMGSLLEGGSGQPSQRFGRVGCPRSPCCHLLDHLVRPLQERRRDRQAKGLGGLEGDHELDLRGLLHRQVGRVDPPQDLVYVSCGPPVRIDEVRPQRQQAPGFRKLLDVHHCRQPILKRDTWHEGSLPSGRGQPETGSIAAHQAMRIAEPGPWILMGCEYWPAA